jgi:hypothetical protein
LGKGGGFDGLVHNVLLGADDVEVTLGAFKLQGNSNVLELEISFYLSYQPSSPR